MRFGTSAVLLATALAFTSCGGLWWKTSTMSIVSSPGGERVAVVEKTRTPGGALSDLNYLIYVTDPNHSGEGRRRKQDVVWRSSDAYPMYVFWTSPKDLEVLVRKGRADRLGTVATRSDLEFTVVTRVVDSSLKEDLMSSGRLEPLPTRTFD